MLNDEAFERLWERAATQQAAENLSHDFPAWQRQQRRRRNAVMSVAAVCVMGASVWFGFTPSNKGYDSVSCNRDGYASEYWIQVANDMLTTQV